MRATKILIFTLFLISVAVGIAIYAGQFELAIALVLAGVVLELLTVLYAQPRKSKRRWQKIDFSSPQSPKRL